MNAITDLTARATSFITAIQTCLLKGSIEDKKSNQKISILTVKPKDFEEIFTKFLAAEMDIESVDYKKSADDGFAPRAIELVWISADTPDEIKSVAYAKKLCLALVGWIYTRKETEKKLENKNERILENMQTGYGEFPTPYNWREAINHILYDNPGERLSLAVALEYLPIQIVLALGGGNNLARTQRILQIWGAAPETWTELLNKEERVFSGRIKQLEVSTDSQATVLLQEEGKLYARLIASNVPLSFEHIFRAELQEIKKNRDRRQAEQTITLSQDAAGNQIPASAGTHEIDFNEDPFTTGKNMKLNAMTFSGGGIRSATFNLGILEGLAQNNLLSRFDYMSTVSGGGYIGSWLAAWIKRDGSVVKVSNRLCPDKSPDPLGEELKPIKWLRMYSNYFAPDASIMSTDAWTVGITWLRNTLLNQVIIFLMLLSVLFANNFFFQLWAHKLQETISYQSWQVWFWSAVFLLPVALMSGLGMHAFHKERIRTLRFRKEDTTRITKWIVGIALAGAYILSAWFSSEWHANNNEALLSTADKMSALLPAAAVAFVALTMVAIFGRYDNCIVSYGETRFKAIVLLITTAAFAAMVGLLSLGFISGVLLKIGNIKTGFFEPYRDELQYIIGVPLALEVFSITVVARMAVLGKYFPDERREWWGRIGALIHRISFLWVLVGASALLGQQFMFWLFDKWAVQGIAAAGGWVALVGATVKAAFTSTTAKKSPGKKSINWLDLLGTTGPYLFAIGLLVFLPGLLQPLIELLFTPSESESEFAILLFCLLTALVAYILAKQLGVNEFSMHHFYRNRLVRAYLGATRRSTDRQRTANPFTGFDMLDDEKLYKMQHDHGYYGPYPILNTALNASQELDLDRQDRKAESFIFSPLFCGFDFSMVRSAADIRNKSYDYAYRQTKKYAYPEGPNIGTAMATSGAAVNPNQGYHSSAASAFLLTVFNVQMGRWIGNPRKKTWRKSDPDPGLGYIFYNMIGKTTTRNDFISLSDGGHFDNMGLYEMIRRKCSFILLCDAEQDEQFTSEGFANAIRRCRIDFGAEIDIDISKITTRNVNRFSEMHFTVGKITYAGDKESTGRLLYIKSSITEKIPVDVQEYAAKNDSFPHQTTSDQFFDEEQFESYRRLGLYIAKKAFKDPEVLEALNFAKNSPGVKAG